MTSSTSPHSPQSASRPAVKLWSVLGNSQKLDGGAMFGHAPKALWTRWIEADDANQIPLNCRCLLIETAGKRVLLETGIGTFFEPKFKSRYGIAEDDHRLLTSLAAIGHSHEDIDAVVLSHLHFDHAGGLLTGYEEGREPELLFPNAEFIIGETAFRRAENPHPRDQASFIPALQKLLKDSGRLRLVEGDALSPAVSCPYLPEDVFRFRFSHGHTPGQMHTEVHGNAHTLLFAGDLIPGEAWLNPAIGMGYDRSAELLSDEKRALFAELAAAGTMVFFTHDPSIAAIIADKDVPDKLVAAERLAELAGYEL